MATLTEGDAPTLSRKNQHFVATRVQIICPATEWPRDPLVSSAWEPWQHACKRAGRDAPAEDSEVAGRGVCHDVPSSVRRVSVTLNFQALTHHVQVCNISAVGLLAFLNVLPPDANHRREAGDCA